MEWEEIFITEDLGEAEIIKGLLAAEGIPALIRDENVALIFPGVLSQVRIMVPVDRAGAAREAIRAGRESGMNDPGDVEK